MNATVYSNELIIGEANLQIVDENMGCISGNFIPSNNYYGLIQEAVWEFWATPKPNYLKWHALNLHVKISDGNILNPEGGYSINDLKELPDEPITIDIIGLHSDTIALFK
jgi:hypothetical protein